MSARVRCAVCDDWHHRDALSARLWCWSCETEFAKLQSRATWPCERKDKSCNSPVTCAMKKECIILCAQLKLV